MDMMFQNWTPITLGDGIGLLIGVIVKTSALGLSCYGVRNMPNIRHAKEGPNVVGSRIK
jgi:hypothetical protein